MIQRPPPDGQVTQGQAPKRRLPSPQGPALEEGPSSGQRVTSHTPRCTAISSSSSSGSGSVSTEIGAACDSDSDSSDFTPWEFFDHPPPPNQPPSRRTSASSRDASSGPYVARITVIQRTEAPPPQHCSSTSPARGGSNRRPRAANPVASLLRKSGPPRKIVPFGGATDDRPASPVGDEDRSTSLLETGDPTSRGELSLQNMARAAKRGSRSASPISSSENGDQTARLATPQDEARYKRRNRQFTAWKRPPSANNGQRRSTLPQNDHAKMSADQTSSASSSQKTASTKHRRMSNENASSQSRKNNRRMLPSTDWETAARRSRKNGEAPPPRTDAGRRSTSPEGDHQRSKNAVCGAYIVAKNDDDDDVGRRKAVGGELGSYRNEESAVGKQRRHAGRRRASTETDEVAGERFCGPDVAVAQRGDAAPPGDRASRGGQRQQAAGRVGQAAEQHDAAVLSQMKNYCMQQLGLPSKSPLEVAGRRRGDKQRGQMSTKAPATQTLARQYSAASAAGHIDNGYTSNISRAADASYEYSSPDEYSLRQRRGAHRPTSHSTMPRDFNPFSANIEDTNNSRSPLKISITGDASRQNVSSSGYGSEYYDSRASTRSRISPGQWDRKRKPKVRPSLEGAVARTNCPSVSCTSRRAGRLSVTITSNDESEPDTPRGNRFSRMTDRDPLDIDQHEYYSQMQALLNHRRRRSSSGDPNRSSSSDDTVDGPNNEKPAAEGTRHQSKRASALSTTSDAAVQVELQLGGLDRRRRGTRSSSSSSSGSDRTATGSTPTLSPSPSKEYFCRSGKDVWRASLAEHRRLGRKSCNDVPSGDSDEGDSHPATKSSRRRTQPKAQHYYTRQEKQPRSISQGQNRDGDDDVGRPGKVVRHDGVRQEKVVRAEAVLGSATARRTHKDELYSLSQNNDRQCSPHDVEVSEKSPSASVDLSLTKAVVDSGPRSEDSGRFVNGTLEELELPAREVTSDHRSADVERMNGDVEKATSVTKTISNSTEIRGQSRGPSDTTPSSSVSITHDTSLTDVVVVSDEVRHPAAAKRSPEGVPQPPEKAYNSGICVLTYPPTQQDGCCVNGWQTTGSEENRSHHPTNAVLSNNRRNKKPDNSATGSESVSQRRNNDRSARSHGSAQHQPRSAPGKASLFTRIMGRRS